MNEYERILQDCIEADEMNSLEEIDISLLDESDHWCDDTEEE